MKKSVLVLLLFLTALGGFACSKAQSSNNKPPVAPKNALTQLTGEDINLILKNESPESLKRVAENPQQLETLLKTLKEILASAAEARATGLADEPDMKKQIDFVTAQIISVGFESEQNPPAEIKPEEIEAFVQEPGKEAEFNALLEVFKKQSAQNAPTGQTLPEPNDEQKKKMREGWAKTLLGERKARAAGFDKRREVELQIAVQQANILAQEINRRKAKEFEPTDAAINDYVKQHPEFDMTKKYSQAEDLLRRAKAGEDFAKLADEFSEDPGNKDPQSGAKNGGLYKNIKKGDFVPPFETAALALENGQIADKPIETNFGYHIIKLESKKGDAYDVRHILISTAAPADATNPFAAQRGIKETVANNIKKEMRDKWLAEVTVRHQINLPKPEEIKIEVPPVTEEPKPVASPKASPAKKGK